MNGHSEHKLRLNLLPALLGPTTAQMGPVPRPSARSVWRYHNTGWLPQLEALIHLTSLMQDGLLNLKCCLLTSAAAARRHICYLPCMFSRFVAVVQDALCHTPSSSSALIGLCKVPKAGGQRCAAMRGQVLAGLATRCQIASLRVLVGSFASRGQRTASAAAAFPGGKAEQSANSIFTSSRQMHCGRWVCRASATAAAQELTINSIKRREHELQTRIGDAVKVGYLIEYSHWSPVVPNLPPPPPLPPLPGAAAGTTSCLHFCRHNALCSIGMPHHSYPDRSRAGGGPAGPEAATC